MPISCVVLYTDVIRQRICLPLSLTEFSKENSKFDIRKYSESNKKRPRRFSAASLGPN